jgi:hypothetical protein
MMVLLRLRKSRATAKGFYPIVSFGLNGESGADD